VLEDEVVQPDHGSVWSSAASSLFTSRSAWHGTLFRTNSKFQVSVKMPVFGILVQRSWSLNEIVSTYDLDPLIGLVHHFFSASGRIGHTHWSIKLMFRELQTQNASIRCAFSLNVLNKLFILWYPGHLTYTHHAVVLIENKVNPYHWTNYWCFTLLAYLPEV
jgi:hypothetical protein